MDTHTECTALPRKESRRRGTLGPGLGLPPRRRRPPRRQQTAQAEGAMLRNRGTKLLAKLPWVPPLLLVVVCLPPGLLLLLIRQWLHPVQGGEEEGGVKCPAIHLPPLPPPRLAQLVALCQNSWFSIWETFGLAGLWMVYMELSINPSPSALAKCQGGEMA